MRTTAAVARVESWLAPSTDMARSAHPSAASISPSVMSSTAIRQSASAVKPRARRTSIWAWAVGRSPAVFAAFHRNCANEQIEELRQPRVPAHRVAQHALGLLGLTRLDTTAPTATGCATSG